MSPEKLTRRFLLFFSPYLIFSLIFGFFVLRTGELLSVPDVVKLDRTGLSYLYLPSFSDRNFQYKRQITISRKPEIIAIGSSRMNQWRSGMFAPYRFYNAAGSLYTQEDYYRFLESLGKNTPRVVFFSLDFFTFNPKVDEIFKYRDYGEGVETKKDKILIIRDVINALYKDPFLYFKFAEPLYGMPAVGLQALSTGTGFRIDGSYQYGGIILNDPTTKPQSVSQFITRINEGVFPFLESQKLDENKKKEFVKFVTYAKSKGITLIGVTMPFAPELLEEAERSEQHKMLREFRSLQTKQWIRDLGVLYFDFSELSAFSGESSEFIDAVHPSEPAIIRMFQVMLRDPNVRAALPHVSLEALNTYLAKSTRFESYFNTF